MTKAEIVKELLRKSESYFAYAKEEGSGENSKKTMSIIGFTWLRAADFIEENLYEDTHV
jgi:hypothetical protein